MSRRSVGIWRFCTACWKQVGVSLSAPASCFLVGFWGRTGEQGLFVCHKIRRNRANRRFPCTSQRCCVSGADKDKPDCEWRTPLHCAAAYGHDQGVWCLLVAGADPDKADKHWRTPLDVAAENGFPEVVRCFREFSET